ncbi:hypothetical protein HDA40_003178 [Hamadaea flava]|uniref:PH domain-containing protein n=1 Tax=Hamadaea flava TaxID=1742688 RepID=A0ABV8LWJ7_9ACTN|nr:hypothetical protein [Hamadaea flava]MCP2324671.1 hypothetical protein [Hamadaea flava]
MTEQNGDRVLWRGEPDRYFFIERSDWLIALIGVVWIAVNVWFIVDYLNERTFLSAVRFEWRVVSLVIGIGVTLGHPLVRGVSLLSTRYTITERQVIVAIGGRRPQVCAMTFDLLLPPVVRRHGDDVGSVAFGEFPRPWDTVAAAVGRRPVTSMIVLRYVGPVDEILALITSARDRAWAVAG